MLKAFAARTRNATFYMTGVQQKCLHDGNVPRVPPNTVAISHARLLSTWSEANVTADLNF